MPIVKKIFSLLVLLLSFKTFSQQDVTKTDQQWIHYYSQINLTEKWTLLVDTGFRWREGFDEKSFYIVRAGVKYALNPKFALGAGLTHTGSYTNNDLSRIELRPHQEILANNKISGIGIDQRLRIEERFFKSVENGSVQTSNTFAVRFRYYLMTSIPICNLSRTNADKKFNLNVGDEIFLQLGNDSNETIFDFNRVLISPTLQFSKNLSISLTYNRQFAAASLPKKFTQTNAIWLQVRHKIDARKKQNRT